MSRAASCFLSDLPATCGAGENMGEEAAVLPGKREQLKLGAEALEVWRRKRRDKQLFIWALQAMNVKEKKAAGGQFCELLVVRYLVTF